MFPLPSFKEQSRVARMLQAHDSRGAKEQAVLAKLRTLQHGLMDDILTSQVRVSIPKEAAA